MHHRRGGAEHAGGPGHGPGAAHPNR
jgi:hypothetical protein